MKINGHEVKLVDDGTLDTVVNVDGVEMRYDQEYVADFRDPELGSLTDEGFDALMEQAVNDFIDRFLEEEGVRGQ